MTKKLAFAAAGCQLCTKTGTMRNEEYEKMLGRLLCPDSAMEPVADFSLMCMNAGVDRVEMNNLLYTVFGMSGDEILVRLSLE